MHFVQYLALLFVYLSKKLYLWHGQFHSNMKNKLFPLLTLAVCLAGCGTKSSDDMEQRIDQLYRNMSNAERIAQLRSGYMNEYFDEQGNLDEAKCRAELADGIGHFSQFASQKPWDANVWRDQVVKMQKWLMENTPNGIPALFHEEVLSGVNARGATVYPQQIGQAGSFNPELAERKTWQTATDMRRMGGVLSLSPMVDVCRNPSFNRLEESYGEDAYLSAVMGVAFAKGLQQGDLKRGVATCSKHFLGYGGGGDADEKELMEEILLPHEAMIRLAGSRVVMTGYHAVHGTKCVANSEIIQDILHNYVGFNGMMVSDYGSIDQLPDQPDRLHKAVAAIQAGNDVDFPRGSNYAYLQQALDEGLIQPETLERAVKNVLRHKYVSGLLDEQPYLYSTDPIELDSPEERKMTYDIATQSVVLLQNNGILPLKGTPKVLLTGPNANSMWAMCGDYSYPAMLYFWKQAEVDAEHPHIVSLREGMEKSQPQGASLLYTRGCDWTEGIETKIAQDGDQRARQYKNLQRRVESGEKADPKEALRLARQADVIVAAVGENVLLCGENRDRPGLRLPGRQEQFVESLIATGKPVVLVVFGGRAQVIEGLAQRCAAVIQAWYPGEEGGNAVADILYGRVAPSAKLSVSYPNAEVYEPLCYNYSVTPDPRVAWPFGYGLSYTTFEYSNLQVDSVFRTDVEAIDLSFQVTNTGSVEADEVAQLYLSPAEEGLLIRPIQLQGFARVSLKPGQTRTVRIRLYTEQLGYYSNQGKRQWNIAPGAYTLHIGASSADLRLHQTIRLTGKAVAKPLREHYFSVTQIGD